MNPFECCRTCVAPKRHPGCGGSCKEYQEAKRKYDETKARAKKARDEYTVYLSVRRRSGPGRFKG